MVVGDVVAWMSNIVGGATITIQPNGTEEWIIHNVYHAGGAKIRISNDIDVILFDESDTKGSWSAYPFHLTSTHFITVENTDATSKLIGYDGIVSK